MLLPRLSLDRTPPVGIGLLPTGRSINASSVRKPVAQGARAKRRAGGELGPCSSVSGCRGAGTTRVSATGRRPPRPSQVGVFRRECAMRILKPFTSNARLIRSCARCHHSEFIHSDPTGGACLFSECKCLRFAPKRQPKDSQDADRELSFLRPVREVPVVLRPR